jgi:4-amino-4-deoxy-L-arabinose transferase-like glycosyltransferase
MTTDQQREPEQSPTQERQPDWWHRDHPTFTALTGFFTGLGFVIVVPGLFAAILGLIFEYDTAEDLFPFVLVTLAIPIGLVIAPRTRRFGLYMLIGMVTTALVVGGVAGIVLWYLVNYQS